MKDKDLDWAVFWASLLQPVVLGEVPPEETGKFLRDSSRMGGDAERLSPLCGESSKRIAKRDSRHSGESGEATAASRAPAATSFSRRLSS